MGVFADIGGQESPTGCRTGCEGMSLKVTIINSAEYAGGAETVSRLLKDGLRSKGHDASLWVGRSTQKQAGESVRTIPTTEEDVRRAQKFARKGFFSLGLPSSRRFVDRKLNDVDIVHLHNLHGHYFSIDDTPALSRKAPLVWTLHDCYALTGGCAFPGDCDRWMANCGECPSLGQYPMVTSYDRTRRMLGVKRKHFAQVEASIVVPSKHLARAVHSSGMFPRCDVLEIPYGVDTQTFKPGRKMARQTLGIDPSAAVVMVAAQGLDDPRKGIAFAIKALQDLRQKTTVILVGSDSNQTVQSKLQMHDIVSPGYISDPARMAQCYAAADLFLFTSVAENFPCSIMESMSCGTPVLAYAIPGVDEQIANASTGYVADPNDHESFSRILANVLSDPRILQATGKAARLKANSDWSMDMFIDRHLSLYHEKASAPHPSTTFA